jgi:hypothetical protein
MVDCGASTVFISQRFINDNNVTTHQYRNPIPLYNIDGSRNMAGEITHYADLWLKVGHHEQQQIMTIINIGTEDVIIGIDWLRKHNPDIGWSAGTLSLNQCPLTCRVGSERNPPTKPEKIPIKQKKTPKRIPTFSMIEVEEENREVQMELYAMTTAFLDVERETPEGMTINGVHIARNAQWSDADNDPKKVTLPRIYEEFAKVFSQQEAT